MASTNFKIFNEDHTKERTFNDSEYANATQRQSGVIPGIALSRLHNKLYFQVSSMCKAIADFIVGKGYDCNDDDVKTITENLGKAIVANGEEVVKSHNESTDAHGAMTSTIKDTLVPTSDTDTLRNQVSELANRIKAATGESGWKEAPAATLASLNMMITNLATGADVTWDGKKFTNHRLGITGLMEPNGYICFGPNVGGLIIQWGMCSGTSDKQDQWFQAFPLSVSKCLSVSLTRLGGDSAAYIVRIVSVVNNGFYWTDANYQNGAHGGGDPNLWIAICQ